MSKKFIIAAAIIINGLCISNAMSSGGASTNIAKDAWLDAMEPMIPSVLCKGFINDEGIKKQLDAAKMDYNKCVSVIPAEAKACRDQLYESIPGMITDANASIWGKKIGECIGKGFVTKYLTPTS
jgi:aspartate ammonia-lyase